MSLSSVATQSPPANSVHLGTVEDGTDSICSSGQNHVKPDAIVNNKHSNGYVASSLTTPLLSEQWCDNSGGYSADCSDELNTDSALSSSVFIKHDAGTSIGEETSLRIALQVLFPYIIAGFGVVGAGAVLEVVKVNSCE